MERTSIEYKNCIAILKEELIPAMGCTEPIAIAYGAALARKTLGELPDRVQITASGNIIKNVKSVIVPNTGNLRGIPAAAAAGIVAGDPDALLEVIARVSPREQPRIASYLEQTEILVDLSTAPLLFDIDIHVSAGSSTARVRIANHHTNVVSIEKNGTILLDHPVSEKDTEDLTDRNFLNMETIFDFAGSLDPADVREILDRQISFNMAIAREGMKNNYGANVGKVILKANGPSLKARCVSMAAAGSDARMSGCELPVIINSGSGNQGITVSVPIVVYAEEKQVPKDTLYRALALANLISIYQKDGIGRLSAFCGAVNAGASAACGIAYLDSGSFDVVKHTLVNTLAITSGIICDGAKSSCAGKIASAVEAGFLGYELYQNGQQFYGGDGIVKRGVDRTVASVSTLGREGMRQTDEKILQIMLDN